MNKFVAFSVASEKFYRIPNARNSKLYCFKNHTLLASNKIEESVMLSILFGNSY